jgi:hypothetical protein
VTSELNNILKEQYQKYCRWQHIVDSVCIKYENAAPDKIKRHLIFLC